MKKIILLITCLGLVSPSIAQAAPREEVSYLQLAQESTNKTWEIEKRIKETISSLNEISDPNDLFDDLKVIANEIDYLTDKVVEEHIKTFADIPIYLQSDLQSSLHSFINKVENISDKADNKLEQIKSISISNIANGGNIDTSDALDIAMLTGEFLSYYEQALNLLPRK